ncbi:3-hydroxybutyrate dehydrogenase [Micromonospora qiuiae]|uniref:3-hydroxybutyrate dehydrogenase n=1 Tax=Micromonospora qiuiae TaxID=502268 RepID=A0ABQ4JLI2_9ACTN|nr:3-hydroxybutyrate dehydrogenase [Micromonospora qiuiae]
MAIADIQPADELEKEIRAAGGTAAQVSLDVTDPESVAAGFAEAERQLGPLDIVVNNAAIGTPVALIQDLDVAAWERTLKINLTGSMLCIQAAARLMRPRGRGAIVNIASNVAKRGLPNRSAYVSSKWGLLGLTQTAALELVDANIRVNAICPGPVATPHLDEVMQGHARAEGRSVEQVAEDWRTGAPMRRFIELDEVANVAVFLASEESSAMTGQALNVTGGLIMS